MRVKSASNKGLHMNKQKSQRTRNVMKFIVLQRGAFAERIPLGDAKVTTLPESQTAVAGSQAVLAKLLREIDGSAHPSEITARVPRGTRQHLTSAQFVDVSIGFATG
jgi:hypothetical protein